MSPLVVLSLFALFALAFAGESNPFHFDASVPVSSRNYFTFEQSIPALNSTLTFKGDYTEKLFVCFNFGAPIPALSADQDLEDVCNPDNFFTLKSNTTENYEFWVLEEDVVGASLEGAFNARVGNYHIGLQLNSNNVTVPFTVNFDGFSCSQPGAVGPNCDVPQSISTATGTVPENEALTFQLNLGTTAPVGVAKVAVSKAQAPPSLLQGALAKNETKYTLWVREDNTPSPDAYDHKTSGNSTDLVLNFEADSSKNYYAVLADNNGGSFNYTIAVTFGACANNTMGKNCDVVVRDVPSQDLKTSYQTPDESGMTYFKFVASTVVFGVATERSNTTQSPAMSHMPAPGLYVNVNTLPTADMNIGYLHSDKEVHVYSGSTSDGQPGTWIFGVETGKNFTAWAGVNSGVTCANDCNGNGVCNADGTCSCTEEWAGFDCSMVDTESTSGTATATSSHSSTNGHTHTDTTSHSSTNGHTHSTVSTSASSSSSSGGGGLKKIYIVLIVIAAVIVLAILIGVPVACYVNHRKRLQYERV